MPRGHGSRSSSPSGGPTPPEAYPPYPATTSASPNRGEFGEPKSRVGEGGGCVGGSFFVGVGLKRLTSPAKLGLEEN
ncbi:hypothetical protein TIFTF001_024911 [Ficus carica]|uniref:Uncharacterized protein n=1 Tax=Ficus carica TaxID=3494 RepID=A0AA88AQH7_FICCA|nr:hypothetical protein TIFTF001_024911 [Ficus carica]